MMAVWSGCISCKRAVAGLRARGCVDRRAGRPTDRRPTDGQLAVSTVLGLNQTHDYLRRRLKPPPQRPGDRLDG